jgi:hypothetical protein
MVNETDQFGILGGWPVSRFTDEERRLITRMVLVVTTAKIGIVTMAVMVFRVLL